MSDNALTLVAPDAWQAEALIQEVTAAGERCLDLYGVQVEVRLLNNQGILHRRRGDIMEAFGSHFHAFELCKEYRNEKHGSSLQRVAVETRALVRAGRRTCS